MGRVKPSGKPTAPSKDKRKSKIFLTKRQRGYVPVQYPQPPRHLRPPHAPNTPRHAIFPPGLPNPLPGTNPRVNDPDLLQRLSLSWTEAEAQAFQRSIPTYHSNIRQGRNLYPAVEEWLVESERAKARLKRYYEIVSIADHRRKKYETMVILDPTRFNRVIEADENLQVRDARTGRLELVVLRDFVGDLDVLAEMDAAVKEQVDIAYDVRVSLFLLHYAICLTLQQLEDPGSMPLYGYSAGLLNRRMLSWGCNVLRLTIPDRVLSLHQHALCSTQAILWAIMRKKLPAEIITEVESGLAGLPRMDWNMKGQPITPIVSTKSRGQDHEIHDLEMGPPGGVCTNLYSRYIVIPFLVFYSLPPTNLSCVSLGVATEKMPAATPGLSPSPPSTPPTRRTVRGPFTPASMASWSARPRTLSSPTGPVLYMVLRPGISTMRGTTFPRVRSLWYTEGSPWKRQTP